MTRMRYLILYHVFLNFCVTLFLVENLRYFIYVNVDASVVGRTVLNNGALFLIPSITRGVFRGNFHNVPDLTQQIV